MQHFDPSKFKMQPLGNNNLTPEVLIAQSSELKWDKLIVAGFSEGHKESYLGFAGNLTDGEVLWLAERIRAVVLGRMIHAE